MSITRRNLFKWFGGACAALTGVALLPRGSKADKPPLKSGGRLRVISAKEYLDGVQKIKERAAAEVFERSFSDDEYRKIWSAPRDSLFEEFKQDMIREHEERMQREVAALYGSNPGLILKARSRFT